MHKHTHAHRRTHTHKQRAAAAVRAGFREETYSLEGGKTAFTHSRTRTHTHTNPRTHAGTGGHARAGTHTSELRDETCTVCLCLMLA